MFCTVRPENLRDPYDSPLSRELVWELAQQELSNRPGHRQDYFLVD